MEKRKGRMAGGRRSSFYANFCDLPERDQQDIFLEMYERYHALEKIVINELHISQKYSERWRDDEDFMARKNAIKDAEIQKVENRLHEIILQEKDLKAGEKAVEFFLKNKGGYNVGENVASESTVYKLKFDLGEDEVEITKENEA